VSNTAALESEMQSLAARLRKARQGLSRGTIVDLTPIEQDVKWLCRSVETLPAEEAASPRPRLLGLPEEVNQLGGQRPAQSAERLRRPPDRQAVGCLRRRPREDSRA